jgi:hypothetical protein
LDAHGNPYVIPVFVIHDPIAFNEEESHTVPTSTKFIDVDIKIRPMGSNISDKELSINTGKLVSDLKAQYATAAEVKPEQIRLFYGGREMVN